MIPSTALSHPPHSIRLRHDQVWWPFCLAVVCLKFIFLAVDPHPEMFMGDSGSYLWTALSGWIPPDRSFLYGFVIRWVSLSTHSLESLLVLQASLGAGTAILLACICRNLLRLSPRLSYASGFVCAVDPLQLVWERYVMTETISLFFYAIMLAFCLLYLRRRKIWQLALVQVFAILAISFRISYLLVVEGTTLVLPLLAFAPLLWPGLEKNLRSPAARALAGHLALSLLLMLGLHFTYKGINGHLARRPPAYLYSSGFSILATWAPVLQPADSPDPRLAQIIAHGSEFHLSEPQQRNGQLYSSEHLIARWKEIEPDLTIADQVAKQTALHALLHRPFSILTLGAMTFLDYFHPRELHRQAKSDLGTGELPPPAQGMLKRRIQYDPPIVTRKHPYSPLQSYFLDAQPYYYLVVLCPLFCGTLLYFVRNLQLLLFFFHASIFLATNSLLAVTASVRYLQPLSFLTIMLLFIGLNYLLYRAPSSPATVTL